MSYFTLLENILVSMDLMLIRSVLNVLHVLMDSDFSDFILKFVCAGFI